MHPLEVIPQALPGLAADRARVRDDAVEAAVGRQPLGGRLVADAGDAGEVVAALPDERGDVGVALRRHAVPLLHDRRRHPDELADAAERVEQRDVVGHELQRVAVAGADHDLEPLAGGLRVSVAMTSSASKPSFSTTGTRRAARTSLISATWPENSCGEELRFALYSA